MERRVLFLACVLPDVGTDSSRAEDLITTSQVSWTSAGTAPSARNWLICSISTSTGEGGGSRPKDKRGSWGYQFLV